jgi:hypothetical protein
VGKPCDTVPSALRFRHGRPGAPWSHEAIVLCSIGEEEPCAGSVACADIRCPWPPLAGRTYPAGLLGTSRSSSASSAMIRSWSARVMSN